MDNYTEQILKKKTSGKQRMMLAGAIAVLLAGCIVFFYVSGNLGLLVTVVGAVLVYFAKAAQSVEYEYLLINDDCEVAKITNKSSRKKAYSFGTGDVQRILPYNSAKFQNELDINTGMSVKNYTSGIKANDEHWYAFMTNGKSGTVAVILELNEKSLDHIKTFYKMKFEQ